MNLVHQELSVYTQSWWQHWLESVFLVSYFCNVAVPELGLSWQAWVATSTICFALGDDVAQSTTIGFSVCIVAQRKCPCWAESSRLVS